MTGRADVLQATGETFGEVEALRRDGGRRTRRHSSRTLRTVWRRAEADELQDNETTGATCNEEGRP